MNVGDKVRIEGETKTSETYVIRGMYIDRHGAESIWLVIEDDQDEGYDSDFVLVAHGDRYRVYLADGRSQYKGDVRLLPS